MKVVAGISILLAVLQLFAWPAPAAEMIGTDHPLSGRIWDTRSGRFIDEVTLLSRLGDADVLLLGETHDNPLHHELQLKLLNARIAAGARPALLMEQLDADTQPALDAALAEGDRAEKLNKVTGLIKFTDVESYRPFLVAAVDNKLPVVAANISSRELQAVIWMGFSAFDADALKRMEVEEVWDHRRQNYLLAHMGGAHCGQLRDELRAGLARGQRLRDAMMADAVMSSVARGVVAIVGSSHARRDVGMPLYIAARDSAARILSLGFEEVIPGRNDPASYISDRASDQPPFDVVWFTPRVARADPCADLKK